MKKLVCACGCGLTAEIPDGQQLKDAVATLGWICVSEVYQGEASRSGHLILREPIYVGGFQCLAQVANRAYNKENECRAQVDEGWFPLVPLPVAGILNAYFV
jgi:hypothetical protein